MSTDSKPATPNNLVETSTEHNDNNEKLSRQKSTTEKSEINQRQTPTKENNDDQSNRLQTPNKPTNERNSPTISIKEKNDRPLTPRESVEQINVKRLSSASIEQEIKNDSPAPQVEKQDDHRPISGKSGTHSSITSPKVTRFASVSSKSPERNSPQEETNIKQNERPSSPEDRHRTTKSDKFNLMNQRRTRSNSPRKNFSYLTFDAVNLRKWKEQRHQFAKQQENDRIYYENRKKLERLARIAKEPSSYSTVYIEQEHLRARHMDDYRRKVLKNYIPIIRENLSLVHRLANVKGAYDVKKMDEDFIRHRAILEQQTAYKKKVQETSKQRPFILPKINAKS